MTSSNPDIAALNAGLVDLVGRRVDLKRRGREFVGLCPFHDEKTPSFTVSPAKGFYHCFGCGAHGDAIGFVRSLDGLSFAEAVEQLSGQRPAIGRPPPAVNRPRAERRRQPRPAPDWCRALWRSCRPAAGSLVETYLRGRGIDPDRFGGIPPSLRYHPALRHADTGLDLPAMVAAVQAPSGRFLTVHRTYLRADGAGKAAVSNPKKIGSACAGGAVRLAPVGTTLALAEGIETALTVMQACADLPVWSALSLGNIAGAGTGSGRKHPEDRRRRLPSVIPDGDGVMLPACVSRVILIADADAKDRAVGDALLARAVARFRARGIKALIARPDEGCDFNDMLAA